MPQSQSPDVQIGSKASVGFLDFKLSVCRYEPTYVNRREGHVTAGRGDNALKTIDKGRSRRGHDRRRLGPHLNANSPIWHKQLAPLVQAPQFGADSQLAAVLIIHGGVLWQCIHYR
jgi:hypothetical protein